MTARSIPSEDPLPVRPPRAATALLVGVLIAVPLLFLGLRLILRSDTPAATFVEYEAALARWRQTAPADYDISIQVAGRQPAEYRVEVRRGEPRTALRNDQPLGQRRTFYTWTVDGMFETLAGDFARLGRPDRQTSVPFDLRVKFDDRYGYPAVYRRQEFGSGIDVEWQVTRFHVPPSEERTAPPKAADKEPSAP